MDCILVAHNHLSLLAHRAQLLYICPNPAAPRDLMSHTTKHITAANASLSFLP
jgi:hypothetical protein